MKYEIEIETIPVLDGPTTQAQTSNGRALYELEVIDRELCLAMKAKDQIKSVIAILQNQHDLMLKIIDAEPKSQGGTTQGRGMASVRSDGR